MVEDESGNTSAISDDEAPTSRNTEFASDSEQNLICCILMLDILLKQVWIDLWFGGILLIFVFEK